MKTITSYVRYRRKANSYERNDLHEKASEPVGETAEEASEPIGETAEEASEPIQNDDYDPYYIGVESDEYDEYEDNNNYYTDEDYIRFNKKEARLRAEWAEQSSKIMEILHQQRFNGVKEFQVKTLWLDGYNCADVTIKHLVDENDMQRFKNAVQKAVAEVALNCEVNDIEEDDRKGYISLYSALSYEWEDDDPNAPTGAWRDIGVEKRDWMKELESITGMHSAKRALEDIITIMKGRAKRDVHNNFSKNVYTFEGNPGCGKTTFAKIFANCLKSEGVISSDEPFHDVHISELVGKYTGQTTSQVNDVFKKYAGSVIFIDEAYSLADVEDFGQEAINQLVKCISDMNENTVLIMAGYPGSMTEFLKVNPGLESRVSERVVFDDYSLDELLDILEKDLKNFAGIYYPKGAGKIREVFKETLRAVSFNSDDNCGRSIGNARAVENLIKKIERYHSIATKNIKNDEPAVWTLRLKTARKVRDEVIEETRKNGTALGAIKPPYLVSPEELKGNTFEGIVGNENAKSELIRLAAIMRKFGNNDNDENDSSANITTGILMTGYPGCGKTAMARAFANEVAKDGAKVAFIVPDINTLLTDSSAIGKLFDDIEAYDRCVLFLDEVDTVGTERTNVGASSPQYTALMTLLTKLDGFKKKGGLFVLSATNHPEVLDFAIRRRLGTEIRIELPNADERILLIKKYIGGKESDISDGQLADLNKLLDGRSGAIIETIVKNALKAAGTEKLTSSLLESAIKDYVIGHKSNSIISPEKRMLIAVHEMGHAVTQLLLDTDNKDVSVYMENRTNGALGYTLTTAFGSILQSRAQYLDEIKAILAGRAAEEVIYEQQSVSDGCSDDLARASNLALNMISRLGMGETLLVRDAGSPAVLTEAEQILKDCYAAVREMLVKNKEMIEKGAEFLESNDVLSNSKLREICGIG